MIDQTTTNELLKILKETNSKNDLETYVLNVNKDISFSDFINEILEKKSLNKSDVIRNANIQRNYGYQIFDGQKTPGRDKVLALSLAMKLSLDETMRALTISGNSILYTKIRRDSIIIFAINKQMSIIETNELLYDMNEETIK